MAALRQKYEDEMKKRIRTVKTTAADKDNALANAPVLSTVDDRDFSSRRPPPPTQTTTVAPITKIAREPKVIDDPVITAIAQRVHKTPAQVVLAWAVQRGTAFLTTSTKPQRIEENFQISSLPEDAMREIREGITTNVRFNGVVETGVPGFIPRAGAK